MNPDDENILGSISFRFEYDSNVISMSNEQYEKEPRPTYSIDFGIKVCVTPEDICNVNEIQCLQMLVAAIFLLPVQRRQPSSP
jgi:hypothetical protein